MTRRACVIGSAVAHSLSPLIHCTWLKKHNINGDYSATTVMPENLKDAVTRLIGDGYVGFNVTLPHKVAIMEFCSTLDPLAEQIGAVNTVSIDDAGRLHGTNTDAFGFFENLRQQAPEWNPRAGFVLVLGAGGAARAILYALLGAGVPEITLANRHLDRAQALAAEEFCANRVTALPWEKRNLGVGPATLIVNTTCLGMIGQDALDIDLQPASGFVYDIVYRPNITPLLAQAQALNLPVVRGLGMLLHQARPGFKAWFGLMPEVDNTLTAILEKAAVT